MYKIVSFGERHGFPFKGPHDLFIDVRLWMKRNPYHDRKLRYLRGDDPEVIEDIEKTPKLEESYQIILARVKQHACSNPCFTSTGHTYIFIGCTGGHHRSVYIADRLGRDLGLPVQHRDYNKK